MILGLEVVQDHKVLEARPAHPALSVPLVLLVLLVNQVDLGLLEQQVLQEVQADLAQLDSLELVETPDSLVALELLGSQAQWEWRELLGLSVLQVVVESQDLLVMLVQRDFLGILEEQVLQVFQGQLEILDRLEQQVWKGRLV